MADKGGNMKMSCGVLPCKDVVGYARHAEDLGYERVWVGESPALYGDAYIALARIAENTKRIGLGTAVAVPNLRHPMATASAIASIEDLAPGRLSLAFGVGMTAAHTLGRSPMKWADLKLFVQQLRALLNGETVYIDGGACQMIHSPGFAPARPIRVPILLAPGGPKGFEIAREIADGVICENTIEPGFDWCAKLLAGTVLDEGETMDSPRVRDAVGPQLVTLYHAMWQRDRDFLAALPGGAEWARGIDAERKEGERHLAVHEGHVCTVTERDRPILEAGASLIPNFSWTGTPDELRQKVRAAEADGFHELVYFPAGSDIPRELSAFATMMAGL